MTDWFSNFALKCFPLKIYMWYIGNAHRCHHTLTHTPSIAISQDATFSKTASPRCARCIFKLTRKTSWTSEEKIRIKSVIYCKILKSAERFYFDTDWTHTERERETEAHTKQMFFSYTKNTIQMKTKMFQREIWTKWFYHSLK